MAEEIGTDYFEWAASDLLGALRFMIGGDSLVLATLSVPLEDVRAELKRLMERKVHPDITRKLAWFVSASRHELGTIRSTAIVRLREKVFSRTSSAAYRAVRV